MVVGLVSGLSLDNHLSCANIWSNSRPSLAAREAFSQDGFQREGFWQFGRTYYGLASLPSFWPLSSSPSYFSVAALYPALGPSVVRQLMQVAVIVPGQGGEFRSMVP